MFLKACTEFEEVCETIFRDWLNHELWTAGLQRVFELDACPEPYLDFGCTDPDPPLFVTHNPGKALCFQMRDAVKEGTKTIHPDISYKENARNLAKYYETTLSEKSLARQRIKGMHAVATKLGASGFRQVELFPLHSAKSPPDKYLDGGAPLEGALADYSPACHRLIEAAPKIIAVSGSKPSLESKSVQNWSRRIGLDIDRCRFHETSSKNGSPTGGAFISESQDRLRILFCRQGANGLPVTEKVEEVLGKLVGQK